MDNKPVLDALIKDLEQSENKQLPPVNDWNPDLSGDIDIRIDREGNWFHEGEKFQRQALVNLFSSILKMEGDEYYLVSPVEKFRIVVDDLPFVATGVSISSVEGEPILKFTTNVGEVLVAGEAHPITVTYQAGSDEPKPSLLVRNNLQARIHRNVFYELVNMAEEVQTKSGSQLQIASGGETFVLGCY